MLLRLRGCWTVLAVIGVGIMIAGCPPNSIPFNQTPPQARFEGKPATGYPPLAVQFTDQSVAGASPISTWLWNFGDGTTSVEQNPKHLFYTPGDYTVSLTVTTGIGSSKREMAQYIKVTEPTILEAIDAMGGSIDGIGARIEVPEGAFSKQVIIGISPGEGEVPIRSAEDEILVSALYTITQNQGDLRVDVRTPLVLEIDFVAGMVPEPGRNGTNLQIIAQLDTGLTIPILGTVEGSTIVATVAGLPSRASYGVVYRPQALLATFPVEREEKSPMSYSWPDNGWRIAYTERALQELTALRIGNFENTNAYDRRNYTQAFLDQTFEIIQNNIEDIHILWEDAGFISPALITSPDNEYTLTLNNFKTYPVVNYQNLAEVTFATSLFGSIVLDPNQLIAISKKNAATNNPDMAQEMDFTNAFSQEFFRAIFRGYDYPKFTQLSPTDFDQYGENKSILFAKGFEDGLAIAMGQVNAEVMMARTLGDNELSVLDLPLFAPYASFTPAYAYSTQDFLIHVLLRFEPPDPLMFVADSYEGILELIRIRASSENVTSYTDATRAMNFATDIALRRAFDTPISDVYWEYVQGRAFENTPNSIFRPSEAEREMFTFQWDRFSDDSIPIHTFTKLNQTQELSYNNYPQLKNVPPLTTRAVLLLAYGVEGDLEISTNAYDFQPDTEGESVRIIVYKDDMLYGYDIGGVELNAENSQVNLTGFGDAEAQAMGKAMFGRAVILFSNATLDRQYSLSLTAKVKGETSTEDTGALGGQVTSDGTKPIQGVSVVVKEWNGTVAGETLASTTTDSLGIFQFPSLPVGDVELTFSKAGYTTQKIERTITANQVVIVFFTLKP